MVKIIYQGALSLGLSATLFAASDSPKVLWEVSAGLKNPESVVYDRTSGKYYVSNIDGDGMAKDQNGFIAQIDTAGKVTKADWVTGLNAPKGLAVANNTLWVADIDELVEIDIKGGKVAKKIPVSGAKFLNDVVTAADGTVFVSDTLGNQIYRYDGKTVTALSRRGDLDSPNGLFVEGNKLIVASWGLVTGFDQTPAVPGSLYSIGFDGKGKKALCKGFGNLDGLERLNDNYVVSDWKVGKLYSVTPAGKVTLLSTGTTGTADLGVGPTTSSKKTAVVLPQMMENKLTAYELAI